MLRQEMCLELRTLRLAITPRLTQLVLSKQLGYPYCIVANWENGTRLLYRSNVNAWIAAVGMDPNRVPDFWVKYGAVVLPDERMSTESGSRVEKDINERFRQMQKENRFTVREIASMTGISTGQLQYIKFDKSSLSVAQLRKVAQVFKVNYEWFIDGKGEPHAEKTSEYIKRLEREIELLESFRAQVIKQQH